MEITTQKINRSSIILEFIQDIENGEDDITVLVHSLEKIKPFVNKTGFGNRFTKEEKGLWNNIFSQLLQPDLVQGLQQLSGDRVYIKEE
jgi:hypothetical protein